ncbi:MAG: tetratricopeptide repeat protein [Planctomycetota bacterium]|nr:tetratricopeptide repeat protein [Planctomycetota bacterium]
MRDGNYRGALTIFNGLVGDISNAPGLQYRIALCLEGLGRWDESLAAYQKIAVGVDPLATACAQVGKARVLTQLQKTEEAEALLWPVVLRSEQRELKNQPMMADARYLLGLTLSMKAFESDGQPALDDARPEHPALDWLVEDALDWISPLAPAPLAASERGKPKPDADPPSLERLSDAPDREVRVSVGPVGRAVVTVFVQGEQVVTLMERLAKADELGIRWTKAARRRLTGHKATVATQNMSLTLLLVGLTERWGLVCDLLEGKTLDIKLADELSDAALRDYRLRTAHNVLQYAVVETPDHRWHRHARLELGNLALRQDNLELAVAHYQLVCDSTSSPFNVVASYNLALAQRLQGDLESARRSLFIVADGAPDHPLGPLASCQIGRTYLDAGELPEAIAAFGHVLSTRYVRPNRELEARAVLYQALAHLLLGESRGIVAMLRQHLDALVQPRYHHAAAFLASYARYQTLTDKHQRTDEAKFLVQSMMALKDDYQWLGEAGALVIGRAYRELDWPDEMAIVYTEVLEHEPRGAIAREIQYALADYVYSSGDWKAAIAPLSSLATAGTDRWTMLARLKLAEYALADNRPQDCLTACCELLRESRSPTVSHAWVLMGQAYEQQGKYKEAARCYARDVTTELIGPTAQP